MAIYERTDADGTWVRGDEFAATPHETEHLLDHLSGESLQKFNDLCARLPCPKEFITKHAAQYGWNDRLVNQAKFYTPQILPRPVPYYQPFWRCYENSFAHARKYGLRYIEGLAIYPGGAMIHAWCSTDGEDVIDYTWPYQHLNKYFGIEWDTDWLIEKGYPNGGVLGHLEQQTKKKLATAA